MRTNEPPFDSQEVYVCDLWGCVRIAAWRYSLDGETIQLCTHHWEIIEEGVVPDDG